MVVLAVSVIYFMPYSKFSILGFAILESKEYSNNLQVTFNESGSYSYLWQPAEGEIENLKLHGTASNKGKIEVYLDIYGGRKLVYSNARGKGSDAEAPPPLDDNLTGYPDAYTENQISLALDYGNSPYYDEDNDGVEALNGIVDLNVNSTIFDANLTESNLCTQWEVYSRDTGSFVQLCHGSEACCSLIGLKPIRSSWNEQFYLAYNRQGASPKNMVSSRVIHAQFSNETNATMLGTLYISKWKSLPVSFTEPVLDIKGACGELCGEQLNLSSYNFTFEIENAAISIERISYSVKREKEEQELVQKKFISGISLSPSGTYQLDLSEYFESPNQIEYSYFKNEKIAINFSNSTAIITAGRIPGQVFTYFTANDSHDSLPSNIFLINISLPKKDAEEIKPVQLKARVGQPVKWRKTVKTLDETVTVNLTAEARNITVMRETSYGNETIEESKVLIEEEESVKSLKIYNIEKKIKEANESDDISRLSSLSSELEKAKKTEFIGITGSVVQEIAPQHTQPVLEENITLIIKDPSLYAGEQVIVEYETEPPVAIEKNISSYSKLVTISSELPYTDITAYSQVPESSRSNIRLNWIVNDSRIEINADEINYIDEDGDSLIEEIEWTVPHLSNQTYEISIVILNIHSYPTLFGNWTVEFNTTGTGNMTISASRATAYGELSDDDNLTINDLELLELKCGNDILFNNHDDIDTDNVYLIDSNGEKIRLSYTINKSLAIRSVYAENFNCDGKTAYHTVRTLTTGAHFQLFNFSGQSIEALNTVANGTCDEGSNLTLCVISSLKGITNGSVLQYNNLTIRNGGALRNQTPGAFFKINASSIIIESGGRIEGNVNITAVNLTVLAGGLINSSFVGHVGGGTGNTNPNSAANGSGLGAGLTGDGAGGGAGGGGAGYGGGGGAGFGTTANSIGGPAYGNPITPLELGSGGAGGDCSNSPGGKGGGLIFINVTNVMNISGNITADGERTADTVCGEAGAYSGGGGAGGSVFITAGTLAGSGSITAAGGFAGGNSSQGGGGGGGRIAVYYSASSYNGIVSALGGSGFAGGGNGTNFTTSSVTVNLALNQSSAIQGRNITIYGNSSISSFNLTNHTISVFIGTVQYFLNDSTNSLQNITTQNLTKTGSVGSFRYNLTVPNAITNHNITINLSLFGITGSAGSSFTVYDTSTPPVINGSINNTSPRIYDKINATFNITDELGELVSANISLNISGSPVKNFSFVISSFSAQISQNITINLTRGSVINITGFAVDANGNVRQNSTLITVANTPINAPSVVFPSDNSYVNLQPLPLNVTIVDNDNDAINISYYINGRLNQTSLTNATLNASDGMYLLNVSASDSSSISSNVTINFTIDTTAPLAFNLTEPLNNTIVNLSPFFRWNASSDANFANYTLQISNGTDFATINYTSISTSGSEPNGTIALESGKIWYWRVIAYDKAGNNATTSYFQNRALCDQGGGASFCIINSTKSITNDTILLFNNLTINSGGSLKNTTALAYFKINASSIAIKSGGRIEGNINITVVNLTVSTGGLINASALGYSGGNAGDGNCPGTATNGSGAGGGKTRGDATCAGGGGGGYGGFGGNGSNGANRANGGSPYGQLIIPADYGSGGAGGGCNNADARGGYGGGAIFLNVSGILNVSGEIVSNGETRPTAPSTVGCFGLGGGGGSGGSILISANTFSGNGTINANGGKAGDSAGMGSGGRIAAYAKTNLFNGVIESLGGGVSTNAQFGENGTNFTATSLTLTISVRPRNANASANVTLSGRISVPGYDSNLANRTFNVYIDSIQQYLNETSGLLSNSSSAQDTNDTKTDTNGDYLYNFSAPQTLKTYAIKANATLFIVSGQNSFNLEVNNPCDQGNVESLCVINTPKSAANGTTLQYLNLTIQNGGALRNTTPTAFFKINASSIIIESGGRIEGNVNITAVNLTLLPGGFINASGLGFAGGSGGNGAEGSGGNGTGAGGGLRNNGNSAGGGGGYGNAGGNASATEGGSASGSAYGSPTNPMAFGSGGAGGDCSGAGGGAGGGFIFINASNLINLTGNVTANGFDGVSAGCAGYGGGGGSGGSILIVANALGGNSSISASGGSASGSNPGGGGSGGRVAAYYVSKAFTGMAVAFGGNGYQGGGNGTNFSVGNLSINTTLNLQNLNTTITSNITISGRIVIYGHDYNLSSNGISIYLNKQKQYFNETSGLLVNDSSAQDTNETMTDSLGLFSYNITQPISVGSYNITVNSTLFAASGTNVTSFIVSQTPCDEGSNSTLCILSSIKYIPNGSALRYNNLTIKNNGALINRSFTAYFTINASNIIIESGGRIEGNVNITAANLTILKGGLINATGLGYAGGNGGTDSSCPNGFNGTGPGRGLTKANSCAGGGGGGYGNAGGAGFGDDTNSSGGSGYGSPINLIEFGSGGAGGACPGAAGGGGGGFIFINVSNILNISGAVNASGTITSNTTCSAGSYGGGGGSGGSIFILAKIFAGNGSVIASGGSSSGDQSFKGGGGAGGRIAVYYTNKSYNGQLFSDGGAGFFNGGAGTNFTAKNLSASIGLRPVYIDTDTNVTIAGRLTIYEYGFNITNHTIGIYLNNIQQFYNQTSGLLANSSSAQDTNDTKTDDNGMFSYNITIPSTTGVYNITVNSTFLSITGTNYLAFEAFNSVCDAGSVLTLCVISTAKGAVNGVKNNSLLQYLNLTIQNGGALRNTTPTAFFKINASSIIIESGGRIEGNVNITAVNLTLLPGGFINASGLGFAGGSGGNGAEGSGGNGTGAGGGLRNNGNSAGGGGGYGNAGGNASATEGGSASGSAYGSPTNPMAFGSGGAGGDCSGAGGGAGGGFIFINASNLINLTGNVTANGFDGVSAGCAGYGGGGGSGGSILIVANALGGNSSISASGGSASGSNPGGGGSGGRVAAYYVSKAFTGMAVAFGGNGYQGGGNGTNFSVGNLSVSVTTKPVVNISSNLTISGRVSIYEYNFNVTNALIEILFNNIKQYLNRTTGMLVGSSSSDTSETATDGSGEFRYNLSGFSSIGEYNLTINATLFVVNGGNSTSFNVSSPSCDSGDNLTTCTISSLKYIAGGTALNYNNLTISNGGILINNTPGAYFKINASHIVIESRGRIEGNVNITAYNLTILAGGIINATGLGNAGGNSGTGADTSGTDGSGTGAGKSGTNRPGSGAGYGGEGGIATEGIFTVSGGSAYGSAIKPVDLGSGGGGGTCNSEDAKGGYGGGSIFINVTGVLNITGNITVDGQNRPSVPFNTSCNGRGGGGGSGGSVWIISDSFVGNGTISANGGDVASSVSSGRGGGGRIAVYSRLASYIGAVSAYGRGIGSSQEGSNGTNFTATNITVRLALNQTTVSQGLNITIYGNLSVSAYDLASHNISVHIGSVQYYLNDSTNALDNVTTNNLTVTNSQGAFNYNIVVPTALGNYTLTLNSTLFNIKGNANDTISVIDTTLPFINGTLNKSLNSIRRYDIINASFNVSDNTGLSFGQVIINDTGTVRYFNFSLAGVSGTFSQNITISCGAGCIINLTGRVNDSSNNFRANATIINITNTPPSAPAINSPSNNSEINFLPIEINITIPADSDGNTLTAYYYIDSSLSYTTASNVSANASEGTHNLSISLYDGADFSANSTINFTYDSTPPAVSIYRKDRVTNKRHFIINGTINDTNTVQNVTIEMNSTYIANASFDNSTKVFNVTVNLTEGWNRYYVLVYDKAGNFRNATSTEQGASVLSDTTTPIIRLITAPNGSTLANGSVVSFEISDRALASASYKINDLNFTSFNFIYDIDVETPNWQDGSNYLIVNATDNIGISTVKNYTFQFSSSYEVFLNVSINYMSAVINDTNSTKTELLNSTQLILLLADSSAAISVDTYNSTISSLGIIGNLTNSISSLQSVLSGILAINSSNATNATKTENISIEISDARNIRNNTLSKVRVSLFDSNIENANASSQTISNVTSTISSQESLSSSDQSAFQSQTASLQSRTNITNIGAVMGIIYTNGRETNITLFEKQINITQQEVAFYINEFLDKNITGNSNLNASTFITNKAETGTFSIIVEDPIIRWSFTNTKSAVIKYTIAAAIGTDSIKNANTVITTVPSKTVSSSSSSSSSAAAAGGGGGGLAVSQAADVRASASAPIIAASPENPAAITINNENIGISSISLEVDKAISNAAITVSSLKYAPAEQPSAPSSSVYQYIRIEKKNIESADIKKASIGFKVAKSWLDDNDLNAKEVGLFRLEGEWKQLPTKSLGEDGKNYYFESLSEGFSLFAIARKVEKRFLLSKDSVSEEIESGAEKEIRLNITNLIDEKISVRLNLEGIKGEIANSTFPLDFGQKHTIVLRVKAEGQAIAIGKLVVISGEETKSVPIILKTRYPKQAYSISVGIVNSTVMAGEDLKAVIKIENAGSAPFNAVLSYFIKDSDNKIVYREIETIYIDKDIIGKAIKVPDGIRKGKYILVVDMLYEGGMDSAASFFNVASKIKALSREEKQKALLIGAIIFVIIMLLDFLSYRFYVYQKPEYRYESLSLSVMIKKGSAYVKAGENLDAEIDIIRRRSENAPFSIRAKLDIDFLDSGRDVMAKKSYPVIIKDALTIAKRFRVPPEMGRGNYILAARLAYKRQTKVAGAWFVVHDGRKR